MSNPEDYKHSKIMDIDVKEKVTILNIELVDENKKVTVTLSNNFIEKLGSLIVLTRMQREKAFEQRYNDGLDEDVKIVKKEILDNYGKALWSDTS